MATSKSNAPMNLDYKHHNIIKTFTSLPVHILLKLYQFGVWVLMVWILTQHYNVFGDTVSLFLFINACLDVLLIFVQSQRPVLRPIRSRDLPSVLCVLSALLLQLLLNVGLLGFIAGGRHYNVYNSAWKDNEWHYFTMDKHSMDEAYNVTVIALLCEPPHLLAWLLYVWARFYPSRSGDVVIDPGYVQAKKEEEEDIIKKGAKNIKMREEERFRRSLEEETRRNEAMKEEKVKRQKDLESNRNFLIAVKCDR